MISHITVAVFCAATLWQVLPWILLRSHWLWRWLSQVVLRPEYGLYTAFIAGLWIIALTGGSRFSVSGPTAAFVVILYPITKTYAYGGLLLASLMSGVLLIIMAVMRLGRFIEYIPESVTLGFTGGIAVVIATLQVKDFFGLSVETMPEHYWDKLAVLVQSFPALDVMSTLVAVVTLAVMLLWPRLKTPVATFTQRW